MKPNTEEQKEDTKSSDFKAKASLNNSSSSPEKEKTTLLKVQNIRAQ